MAVQNVFSNTNEVVKLCSYAIYVMDYWQNGSGGYGCDKYLAI